MLLKELESKGLISLGRGQIISKDELNRYPGEYPVYSSSASDSGEFGRYGKYMFDDERITWSIDGGGKLFYRNSHKYSVTNVCGWLKVNSDRLLTKYVYYCLYQQWSYRKFDYQYKAHPSIIKEIYDVSMIGIVEQKKIVESLDKINNLIKNEIDSFLTFSALIKSRFIELFGNPDLSPQKADWQMVTSFSQIVTGTTPTTGDPENWDGDILWITPAEIEKDAFYLYDTERKITEKGRKSKSLSLMPKGTVILSTRAPIEIGRAHV